MATDPPQRSSFFRPGELPRLLAMVGMLAVMGMFIFQARDPSMWRWLTHENEHPDNEHPDADGDLSPVKQPVVKQPAAKNPAPVVLAQADSPHTPGESKDEPSPLVTAAPVAPADKPAAPDKPAIVEKATAPEQPAAQPTPEPEIVAGTNLDPDEVSEFRKDIEPVTDGILEIPGVETKAYSRLFRWVDNQSFASLKKHAKKAQLFREYAQRSTAEDHRGDLVWLDLNIRRITPVDVSDNPVMAAAGIDRVYEVWGPTDQSQAFFYCCVTAHLPEGLKPGIVHQRGRFYGFYFKVLGYLPGGAKPNARPTPAPLFVGRLDWQPPKVAAAPPENNWNEAIIGGAIVGLGLCGWLLYRVVNRGARPQLSGALPSPEASAAGFAQFLERGAADHPLEQHGPLDHHGPFDQHTNGHSAHGTGLPYSDQSEA